MDGGTAWNINLVTAIDKCKAKGFTDSQIILDIINCRFDGLNEIEDTGNSIANYMRYYDINSNFKQLNDIYEFMRARPDI